MLVELLLLGILVHSYTRTNHVNTKCQIIEIFNLNVNSMGNNSEEILVMAFTNQIAEAYNKL